MRPDLDAVLWYVGVEHDLHQRVVDNLRGGVDQLQYVGLGVVVPKQVDALVEPRDTVVQKLSKRVREAGHEERHRRGRAGAAHLLVDEVAGQILERLERQLRRIRGDQVADQAHLEEEGDVAVAVLHPRSSSSSGGSSKQVRGPQKTNRLTAAS